MKIYTINFSDLHSAINSAAYNIEDIILREAEEKVKDIPQGNKILVIIGDIHNYFDKDISKVESLLKKLSNKMGLSMKTDVLIVPGNHDVGNNTTRKPHLGTIDHLIYEYEFGYGVSISNDFVLPNKEFILPKREIIVPQPEIISGITVVNDSLVQQAKKNPMIMHQLTPYQFEEMVCELFEKQGFHVSLTKQTHDGGKDLIVLRSDPLGEFCVYMDCKKFSQDHPVGVKLVRELYGTVEADRVTAGKIVTTSYFSKEAKEFTETVRYRMSLMDFNEIVRALQKV